MDIYEFAAIFHRGHCPYSHMDQCTWDYEIAYEKEWGNKWEREFSAHKRYLDYAKTILEGLPEFTPEQIIKVLQGVKTATNKGRY